MRTVEELEEQHTAAVERLAAWDAKHSTPERGGIDHGILNVPVGKRGLRSIDSLARERAALARVVEVRGNRLARARHSAAAPAQWAAAAAAHEAADLKSQYGGCGEVLWTLAGGWLKVVRWNKKSVTVRMGADTESIPHDQVGGAR